MSDLNINKRLVGCYHFLEWQFAPSLHISSNPYTLAKTILPRSPCLADSRKLLYLFVKLSSIIRFSILPWWFHPAYWECQVFLLQETVSRRDAPMLLRICFAWTMLDCSVTQQVHRQDLTQTRHLWSQSQQQVIQWSEDLKNKISPMCSFSHKITNPNRQSIPLSKKSSK